MKTPQNKTGIERTATRFSLDAVVSWRRLKANELTKYGDRPMYAGGIMGTKLPRCEIGMKAGQVGYMAIVRRVSKPANPDISDRR